MKTLKNKTRSFVSTLLCLGMLAPINPALATSLPAGDFHDGSVEINGSFDPFKNMQPAKSGPFNRNYNGVELIGGGAAMEETAYLAKSLEMTSFLWGISEVGEKLCKPVGVKHPQSLVGWWLVIKNYVAAEKARDALLNDRIEILKKKMDSVIADKSTNSNLQLKAIEFQIESLNISIDTLSGSTLYSYDDKAAVARATARIPWREALYAAAYEATKENVAENLANNTVYGSCRNGMFASIAAANAGCARTKKVKVCAVATATTPAYCTEETVKDPVPGSCQMAASYVPKLQTGPIKDLVDIYVTVPIPSKSINGRIVYLGEVIKQTIKGFPVSSDAKYDWTSPLESCLEPMMTTIKNNGMICPSDAPVDSYDKAKVDKIAVKEKPITVVSDTVAQCISAVTANMKIATDGCNKQITILEAHGCTDANAESCMVEKTTPAPVAGSCQMATKNFPDMLGGALNEMNNLLNFPMTKEIVERMTYLGTLMNQVIATNHASVPEYDWNANLASCRKSPMVAFKIEEAETTQTVTIEQQVAEDYKLPDVATVSASAQAFLAAMGIYEPALTETTKKFKDNWNTTDLYIGQPIARTKYFEYVNELIPSLINADKAKLASMLETRNKLIKLHEETKKLYSPGNNGGAPGSTNPVLGGNGTTTSSAIGNQVLVSNTNQEGLTTTTPKINTLNNSSNSESTDSFKATLTGSKDLNSKTTANSFSSNNNSNNKASSLSSATRGSENGRTTYAVSPYSKKKIDESKKNLAKLKTKLASAGKDAGVSDPENSTASKIAKSMARSMNNDFLKSHGAALMSSMDGITEKTAGEKEQGSASGSSSFSNRDYSYGHSNGGSYNRGSSYSSGSGSMGRSGTSSPASLQNRTNESPSNVATNIGVNSSGSSNGIGNTNGDGNVNEFKQVDKLDLFDQISKRYNTSGRTRLGLEVIPEAD